MNNTDVVPVYMELVANLERQLIRDQTSWLSTLDAH